MDLAWPPIFLAGAANGPLVIAASGTAADGDTGLEPGTSA
jgi:hypothetical protein